MARFTLFDLRHFVHTLALLTVPFPSAILTDWILTFHFLFVCLLEWDTAFPDTCPLPHTSHFLDIYRTSSSILSILCIFLSIVIFICSHSNECHYTTTNLATQAFFWIKCGNFANKVSNDLLHVLLC